MLLARENLFYSFMEYYFEKFNKDPSIDILKQIATIISFNIWQMDGLKYVIPESCTNKIEEITLFGVQTIDKECDGCSKNIGTKHNGIRAKIKDWKENKTIEFVRLLSHH
ncbi:hypothetical protein [Mycoplasmopsis alligatoris]|uniref:Type II restriction endonuclease family protein n=1 Tax=Mycoplasmopsis alligatoris A21JP2 TaxID=747682 RepID=D4XV53_9BACT|nr:hypothetical protein [Mycoplasmopsis alligatoris]EFF41756.1 type II restriction endonuclease family protein [Mycoplasmopsis alligatoris A21JP2]